MLIRRRSAGISGGGGRSSHAFTGATKFTDLSDTQPNYTGAADKFVSVKHLETGLEFTDLPPLAITDTFVVNSEAAMLALVCQVGDVAIRTDLNQTFILQVADPTILAHWQMLLVSPTHAIGGALHTADTLTHLKSKVSAPDTLMSSDAGEIAAFAAKAAPIAADILVIEDSADANKKKSITIGTLPAAAPAAHAIGGALHTADTLAHLKSKVSAPDTLMSSDAGEIAAFAAKAAPIAADLLVIEDSADANKKKNITIQNLFNKQDVATYRERIILAGNFASRDEVPTVLTDFKIKAGNYYTVKCATFLPAALSSALVIIGGDYMMDKTRLPHIDIAFFAPTVPVGGNTGVRFGAKLYAEPPGTVVDFNPGGGDIFYNATVTAAYQQHRANCDGMTLNRITAAPILTPGHTMLWLYIFRDYTNAADTYDYNVYVPFIELHYWNIY